mmetsp:Transcript_40558/g.90140  ORF Transcript_40558/g.90140 Transcript_40558/m.90140 type:complete len:275 (+) Transcript_40558:235-1059(+)
MRRTSAAVGARPCSTWSTSAAARSCTLGLCASRATVQARAMADVSWPATSSVISSSRRDWSLMPTPSSSVDVSRACSRSVRGSPPPSASSLRRPSIKPYTTLSSCCTAAPNSRLSSVGSHSGSTIAAPALRVKNSNALLTAATICAASDELLLDGAPDRPEPGPDPLRSDGAPKPNRASSVIWRVSSLKSAYTSRTPPCLHCDVIMSCVAPSIDVAYCCTAALRKAGFDRRRCLRQMSPSLTSRPLPVNEEPGKNAVPFLMKMSASSTRTCRAA